MWMRNERRRLGPGAWLLYDDWWGGGDRSASRSDLFRACAGHWQRASHAGPRTAWGSAEQGYLHCGPNGAGHFVKMVHNGIEYGIMAAYAEGMAWRRRGEESEEVDAETSPLRNPAYYQYELNLADVSEVWCRGSVIGSWLLDLTATALATDAQLAKFGGRVSDSGEGRWTIEAGNR